MVSLHRAGMQRMRSALVLAGLLCSPLLSACKELPPPATAAATAPALAPMTAQEQEREPLMRAVFGAHYRPATRDALVSMALRRDKADTRARFFVDAVSHALLANGDTALVANGVEMDEDGDRLDGDASPGFLSVFILRQAGGQWHVQKRHENIAQLGSFGSFGTVQWVALAPGKPGLAVLTDAAWNGYFIYWLSLFDPAAELMQNLGGMRLSSGGQDDCAHEPVNPCWSIMGKWRFVASTRQAAYDDLLFDFAGMHVRQRTPRNPALPEGEPDPVITPVKAVARYAFDGKTYQLVEGDNPVPGL
jgi:hypothetical protein